MLATGYYKATEMHRLRMEGFLNAANETTAGTDQHEACQASLAALIRADTVCGHLDGGVNVVHIHDLAEKTPVTFTPAINYTPLCVDRVLKRTLYVENENYTKM